LVRSPVRYEKGQNDKSTAEWHIEFYKPCVDDSAIEGSSSVTQLH